MSTEMYHQNTVYNQYQYTNTHSATKAVLVRTSTVRVQPYVLFSVLGYRYSYMAVQYTCIVQYCILRVDLR